MAATLCHSYMESRIHRLILSSPKPLPPPQKSIDLPFKSNTWTTIQALSTAPKEITSVDTYLHPALKPSSHRLSPKSLELCTENLGNETGSDIIESGIELLSSHSSECGEAEVMSPGIIREKQKRKAREGRSFPPPLTTITGSESIRVRPHREGGRLVLQLIKVPSSFQAERSPGRLRLCFWTEMHHHHIEDAVEDDQEDQVEKTQDHHQHDDDDVNVGVDVDDDEDGVDPENNDCEWELFQEHTKERKTWGVKAVVRVQSTKFEWPSSRCKEEEHDNINDLIIYWGEPVRLISI